MKILSAVKQGRRTFFKFLGITYCWKIINEYNCRYKKCYFGGLIRTKRVSWPLGYDMIQKIYLWKFLVLEIKDDGEYRCCYLFNKLIKKMLLKDLIKQRYLKFIDNRYDHIYVLNANSGEIYLFLMYVLDILIKRNKSKNPLLLTTKKYHTEMIKMICPDIPYLYLKNYYQNIRGSKYEIDNFVFYKIFPQEHFLKVEHDARTKPLGEMHYFTSILETFNIELPDISARKINSLVESENSMLRKVSRLGLNLDNFVIISPEAHSCILLPDSFWVDLIHQLQEQGFDIFVNMIGYKVNLSGASYKKCRLTYSEAFSLAKLAKKIYSLRSGFTEFLLETKVPMEVYYTKFRNNDLSANQIHSEFGLLKIPNTDKNLIKEIVIE